MRRQGAGPLDAPIAQMREDHVDHGELLERMAELTGDFTVPEGGCGTWRALYAGAAQFRDDLIEHIHIENKYPVSALREQRGLLAATLPSSVFLTFGGWTPNGMEVKMPDNETVPDAVAAAAFWRLVRHLQHRTDVQNVDMMGLTGFCRNCLSKWLEEAAEEAGAPLGKETARASVYGMSYDDWEARHQKDATPEQLERMRQSVARNLD